MTTHEWHPARLPRWLGALAVVAGIWTATVATPAAKKINIKTEVDKTFSFAGLKTWTWHHSGTGEVKVALTPQSDPAKLKALADPVIVAAVERELAGRGFTKSTTGTADLYVTYWLLVTIGQSSQYMGQFIGVPEWGLPPFAGSTTAMRAFPSGTLLIDILSKDGDQLVWRGAAQGEIDLEKTYPQRKQRLEEAIHKVLERFPPKK